MAAIGAIAGFEEPSDSAMNPTSLRDMEFNEDISSD